MPAAGSRSTNPRSRQCNPTRVRRCLRVFFGHLFSNLGLFALVVGYVLLGALLFEFLEAGYELEQRGHIQQYREDCLKELWLITERLNVLYEKNWTHLVHEQLRKFETNVVAATKVEGYDGKDLLDSDRQWSFSGALLYSVTVITTIGYGNLAPKTPEGKVVTMLYALIGVPLMLLCLSNLGTLLAGTFQFAYSHACCFACGKNHSSHHHHHHNHQKQADHQQQQTHQHYHFEKQRQQHHNQRYQQEYKRRVSRAPPYTPTAQITTNYDKTVVITELPKKVASPVVPKNIPPVVATVKITTSGRGPRIQSRPRPPRPLTPEVRKLLTECAEYSLAQEGGGSTDPAAAKLLQELHNQDPEAGNVAAAAAEENEEDAEKEEEEEDDDDDDDDDDEELDELEDPDQEQSVTAHDTPSRVPLIWRPPGDHHHHHQVQKRPPTPPPRRPPRTPSDQDNSSIAPDTPDVTGHAPHSESSSSESTVRVPVSIVLLVLTGYICLGATVFAAWEEWTFLDGAYFCFITLSTIGFGDLVPGKSFQRADTQNGQLQLVACCAYLLLGLVLIAMSFTLVQEEVIAKCRQVALFIGILKRSPPR